MRNVSDLIHVFKDTGIAGFLIVSNYLFCIVVVEKNAASTATYNLLVRFLSMRDIHDTSVFVNNFAWYLKQKYSGSYLMLLTITTVNYYTCNY